MKGGKALLGLVLVLLAVVFSTDALLCYVCDRVDTFDGCVQACSTTEACFMDEMITDQLTIVFSGGCRTKQVCNGGRPSAIGKREDLVACSKCCTSEGCNSRMCGIKSSMMNVTGHAHITSLPVVH